MLYSHYIPYCCLPSVEIVLRMPRIPLWFFVLLALVAHDGAAFVSVSVGKHADNVKSMAKNYV